MKDILAEICATKAEHVAACKLDVSFEAMHAQAAAQEAPRGFHKAITTTIDQGHAALIAEIKKASPSKGVIREDFDPVSLAADYKKGGATCLSILTDHPYFQGEDRFIIDVRQQCDLPILRKDFMIDPYQVVEARALGADCILLIMAALSDAQSKELEAVAHELHMDVLVETHDAEEIERALTHLDSTLIGINNRNLKTLEIDLAVSEELRSQIPNNYTLVCESGIYTHDDIIRMQRSDMHCFLVGHALMEQDDVAAATEALLNR